MACMLCMHDSILWMHADVGGVVHAWWQVGSGKQLPCYQWQCVTLWVSWLRGCWLVNSVGGLKPGYVCYASYEWWHAASKHCYRHVENVVQIEFDVVHPKYTSCNQWVDTNQSVSLNMFKTKVVSLLWYTICCFLCIETFRMSTYVQLYIHCTSRLIFPGKYSQASML